MSKRSWTLGMAAVVAILGLGICWGYTLRTSPAGPAARAAMPRRIASLTLATDEILADLVPVERVVSVTYLADDPEISNVAGRYPDHISRLRDTGVERLLALAPDLVCVAPYNTADALKLLERSGLPTYRNDAVHSLDEIETGIRRLGEEVGEPDRARALADRMRGRRQALAHRLANLQRRPRVLYWSAGFTAGPGSTLDDIIREGGAFNVAAELGLKASTEISPERVVAADPEVVLVSKWSGDQHQTPIDRHPILRNLRAVRREGHVVSVEGRYLTSISHYAVEGAERMARQLHPERFASQEPP